MPRRSLTTKQRERLYEAECVKAREAKRGDYPICNICDLPVQPGQDWDDSHRYLPHALGGERDGIAHRRCNREHGQKHDTPLVAKMKRVRQKHIGATRKSGRRLPGCRDSQIRITISHGPVWRDTGKPVHTRR